MIRFEKRISCQIMAYDYFKTFKPLISGHVKSPSQKKDKKGVTLNMVGMDFWR